MEDGRESKDNTPVSKISTRVQALGGISAEWMVDAETKALSLSL